MDPKNIYVFTDIDLDGTASLLALHWALNIDANNTKFKTTTVSNFRKEFLKWLETDSINNYDQVYFLDLDVSTSADIVDHPKSVIIDHHVTHVQAKDIYKLAHTYIVETTSCAKLVYAYFKGTLKLDSNQKYFIVLADDYHCYKFAQPETSDLNCLFSNTQRTLDKTRTHKFIERYYNGFVPFNVQERNIIKEYTDGRDAAIKTLQIYTGKVSLGKNEYVVTGTMGRKYVNDVCDHLIKHYNSDVVFFINPTNQHVSFRKKKECPVNLAKLATALCEGGGHEYSAGGKLTDTFLEFTKQLTLLEK